MNLRVFCATLGLGYVEVQIRAEPLKVSHDVTYFFADNLGQPWSAAEVSGDTRVALDAFEAEVARWVAGRPADNPRVCRHYTRPPGVLGGPCLICGASQPEHAAHWAPGEREFRNLAESVRLEDERLQAIGAELAIPKPEDRQGFTGCYSAFDIIAELRRRIATRDAAVHCLCGLPATQGYVQLFLHHLSQFDWLRAPEVALEPDGDIGFDWLTTAGTVSAHVSATGRAGWAALVGDHKSSGSWQLPDWPEAFTAALRVWAEADGVAKPDDVTWCQPDESAGADQ